jgi:hypothetical protein
MTPIEADRLRFSGYQLNLITLDETGPAYAVAEPHPMIVRPEPEWWAVTGMYGTDPFNPYFMPNMKIPIVPFVQ